MGRRTTAIAKATDQTDALDLMWSIYAPARRSPAGRWVMWWIEREAAMILGEPEPSFDNAFRIVTQQFFRELWGALRA